MHCHFGPDRAGDRHITAVEHHADIEAFAREGELMVSPGGEKMAGPHLDAPQCREPADPGAIIELAAQCCHAVFGAPGRSAPEMAVVIRAIGLERCSL